MEGEGLMGYMQGVTKKGIDLVSRVTGLLNELTVEDFEDTYVALRVSLMEEDLSREVGFWSNEYEFGNWAFFDGARSDIETRKSTNTVSVEELTKVIDDQRPNNRDSDEGDSERQALAVISLLKEKRILP